MPRERSEKACECQRSQSLSEVLHTARKPGEGELREEQLPNADQALGGTASRGRLSARSRLERTTELDRRRYAHRTKVIDAQPDAGTSWGISVGRDNLSFGQDTNASLSGTVTDPSSAAIPGAKLTLTNDATGFQSNFVSDAAGDLFVPTI